MPKRKQRPDPIADYVEWTNNRYNPGYYLGGNIPPYLRKSSLGPRARRLASVPLAITAIVGASIAAMFSFTEDVSRSEVLESFAGVVLFGWAAVAMWRSARNKSATKGEPAHDREHI